MKLVKGEANFTEIDTGEYLGFGEVYWADEVDAEIAKLKELMREAAGALSTVGVQAYASVNIRSYYRLANKLRAAIDGEGE